MGEEAIEGSIEDLLHTMLLGQRGPQGAAEARTMLDPHR